MERKEHYRMYKHGKQWLFSAVAATSVMMLAAQAKVAAHADTNQQATSATKTTTTKSLAQTKQVALATSGTQSSASTSTANTTQASTSAVDQSSSASSSVTTSSQTSSQDTSTSQTSSASQSTPTTTDHATSSDASSASTTQPTENNNGHWTADHQGYYGDNGQLVTGYQAIDGQHYFFNQQGQIQSDIQQVGDTYYYFDPKTYQQVDNAYVWSNKWHNWYMFGADGQIVTDIYKYDGTYYYFDPQTYLKVTDSYVWSNKYHHWYMFDQNGQIVTDIYKYKGTYYFFDPQTYLKVTDSYVWSNKWHNWYMFDQNGQIVTDIYKYKGTYYFFDPKTYLKVTDSYVWSNKYHHWYMFGQDGRIVSGLYNYRGATYYFDPVTYLKVINETINLGYGNGYFDNNGIMQSVLLNFTYYSQLNQGAPEGCEGTSLQIAESVRGWHHSLQQIYGTVGYGWDKDCYNGFYGNPFGGGIWKTQTVTSSWMAYMLTNLDPGIHDMTGASIQDVIHELQFGHAVVTWANYDWNANPSDQNDYHVMTIVGYRNGQFLIADPYSYSRRVYWVNQGTWNYVNKNEHANGWNLPTGMNLTV